MAEPAAAQAQGADVEVSIAEMRPEDWPSVSAIYGEGLATRNASFETHVPSYEQWDATRLPAPRLVARGRDGAIVGWAVLGRVSRRQLMSGVAEVSVYVADRVRGRGVGRRLLERLIEDSEDAGIWTLQASVFPENEATIRLHQGAGFRIVGRREQIAVLDGRWRDTLLLERRSHRAGVAEPKD